MDELGLQEVRAEVHLENLRGCVCGGVCVHGCVVQPVGVARACSLELR